jgi:hypothetical protein
MGQSWAASSLCATQARTKLSCNAGNNGTDDANNRTDDRNQADQTRETLVPLLLGIDMWIYSIRKKFKTFEWIQINFSMKWKSS